MGAGVSRGVFYGGEGANTRLNGTPLEPPNHYAGLSDRLFGGSFSLFGEVV